LPGRIKYIEDLTTQQLTGGGEASWHGDWWPVLAAHVHTKKLAERGGVLAIGSLTWLVTEPNLGVKAG
jgi:hypothetical protein